MNETWREETEECWITEGGHTFMGAGWQGNSRGMGILLHRRWAKRIKNTTHVTERLITADVKIQDLELRLISCYFPHSGYNALKVQEMYTAIQELKQQAEQQSKLVILGGDFNAEVGSKLDEDEATIIGKHGLSRWNSRGVWLKH